MTWEEEFKKMCRDNLRGEVVWFGPRDDLEYLDAQALREMADWLDQMNEKHRKENYGPPTL